MNHLQTIDQHTKDMDNFKLTERAYHNVWEVENKSNNNSNNNNNDKEQIAHVCVPDNHLPPSKGITSSTTPTPTPTLTTTSWHDKTNNNSKKYGNSIQKTSSWLDDAEVKRQKRVVKYKAYAVEGKVKASVRNGFRWVKNKYCELVYGY